MDSTETQRMSLTKILNLEVSVTTLGETSWASASPMGFPREASIVQNVRSFGPNQEAASFVGE